MEVNLKGLNTGIEISFLDDLDYKNKYGRPPTKQNCYDCNVNSNLEFWAWNWTGFFSNLPITSYTEVGVGQIGGNWRGNYLDFKTISWGFKNVFSSKIGGISPNELLNTLFNTPDEVIEVSVRLQSGDLAQALFFANSNTNTESGIIELTSVLPDNGAFWNLGTLKYKDYIYEQYSYIDKKLPQVLLDSEWYPFQRNYMSTTNQKSIFSFGADNNTNGFWNSCTIELNDQKIYYDNRINQDKYIIINGIDEVITNEIGEDRSSDIVVESGDSKFLVIKVGTNLIKVVFDEEEKIHKILDLPTDTFVSMNYENLSSSLPGGKIDC